jgi:diadenosine tetraphosphate (Ap4A) HIT family hydrolase
MFELDSRLHNDTFFVCDLTLCRVLLMNDKQFPWLILVPMRNNIAEIIDLPEQEQQTLLAESAKVSTVLQQVFSPYKLNVGALGNVVRQLHVHHVARFENDVAWPKPVWGNQAPVAYDNAEASAILSTLKQALSE